MGYCFIALAGILIGSIVSICMVICLRQQRVDTGYRAFAKAEENMLPPEVKNEVEQQMQSLQSMLVGIVERAEKTCAEISQKEATVTVLIEQLERKIQEYSVLHLKQEEIHLWEAPVIEKEAGTVLCAAAGVPQDYSDQTEKVHELSRQGMSQVEIAKTLGLGIGEVSLYLGLFNKRS